MQLVSDEQNWVALRFNRDGFVKPTLRSRIVTCSGICMASAAEKRRRPSLEALDACVCWCLALCIFTSDGGLTIAVRDFSGSPLCSYGVFQANYIGSSMAFELKRRKANQDKPKAWTR